MAVVREPRICNGTSCLLAVVKDTLPEDKGEQVEEKRLTSPQSVESMEFTEEQLNCIGQNNQISLLP